ncbi:MAG: AraC family transcriptional regulator ligand-binding domain-containing protein [Bacteroides sp.]
MYLTAGTYNVILRQVSLLGLNESEVLAELGVDNSLLENTTNKVDANVVGHSIEYIVRQRPDIRIGLTMGFNFPVSVIGVILNVYQNCRTLKDVFDKSPLYAPAVNTICLFSNHTDEHFFYHTMKVADEFSEKYPVATKHIYESQYGIILQLIYALTGKRITPISVSTLYTQNTSPDLLETLVQCPVKFGEPFVMVFEKDFMQTPVINANAELLSIAERLVSQLLEEEQLQITSSIVRRYILQTIPGINLSLKSTACNLNMSERTLQRKLISENTSYQNILDGVRKELAKKYLEENVSFVEISFLLGFESQSAFNKFFKKHFGQKPTRYRDKS